MDSIIYKVIFRAHKKFDHKNLTLSFRSLEFKKPLSIPAKFTLELKKLSETNQHIISFQNIEEVLIIGNPTIDLTYNYYLVILYTHKSNKKKIGYLIGNIKNLGDIVIGVWPFNRDLKDLSEEIVLESYNDMMQNPGNYNTICLITQ
ncbi:MAG: hypothetical protein ACFFDY_07720 [Candidatus Thorarchaeota archaeon]